MTVKLWLSCRKFTIQANYERESRKIVWAAPVANAFHDQPLDNLLAWLQKFGGLEVVELP